MRPVSPPGAALAAAFRLHLLEEALLPAGSSVVVALSGGGDSTTLLHLLRFAPGLPSHRVTAAHFDHGMRAGSGEDAAWVRGLARAWGVELVEGTASTSLAGEGAARVARYRFLEEARRRVGADAVWTAHHADDQAETVLFRVLRGTGVRGLAGIRARRSPNLVRPLLPFRREELEGYARAVGVEFRPDPTNLDLHPARNRIRHRLLPLAEEVAPGARQALVRLGALAAEREEGWEWLLERLEGEVLLEASEGRRSVARDPFLLYHSAVRAGLLRRWARALGVELTAAGTRLALAFSRSGGSGRTLTLPGGLRLTREYETLSLLRVEEGGGDRWVSIPGAGGGSGHFSVSGRRMTARWSLGSPPPGRWVERFASSRLHFPLLFRGWIQGDRIRLASGTKKLKKLFAEIRLPAGERRRTPVLSDAQGRVLWIPGVIRSVHGEPSGAAGEFLVSVDDADRLA